MHIRSSMLVDMNFELDKKPQEGVLLIKPQRRWFSAYYGNKNSI